MWLLSKEIINSEQTIKSIDSNRIKEELIDNIEINDFKKIDILYYATIWNKRYNLGFLSTNNNSIYLISTVNRYLRDNKKETIKNLWYNIIKKYLKWLNSKKKKISIENITNSWSVFWEKTIPRLKKEWIINSYKVIESNLLDKNIKYYEYILYLNDNDKNKK